jgi:hypothetical protein
LELDPEEPAEPEALEPEVPAPEVPAPEPVPEPAPGPDAPSPEQPFCMYCASVGFSFAHSALLAAVLARLAGFAVECVVVSLLAIVEPVVLEDDVFFFVPLMPLVPVDDEPVDDVSVAVLPE